MGIIRTYDKVISFFTDKVTFIIPKRKYFGGLFQWLCIYPVCIGRNTGLCILQDIKGLTGRYGTDQRLVLRGDTGTA